MPPPIPIEMAMAHILRQTPWPVTTVDLAGAPGCVLAQDVRADRDWPPFHRSMVDGYALFSSDTRSAPDVLEVIEEVPAGREAARVIAPGQAIKIMTGAPLPAGADCVIMKERTQASGTGYVRVMATVRSGQNVSRRGEDATAGGVLLKAGTLIGSAETGVLAAAGCQPVGVRRSPLVAIMGSGDELVEPQAVPGPAQIRNSNSYQLLAQCGAHRFRTRYLGIAADDRAATRRMIEDGLGADVLVATGGVSVGDHDHVGAAMRELGVEIFFDKVAVKPGKPTTFGRRGQTLVFGLPGNPVAALVCFHLFVVTAIRQCMGASDPLPRWLSLPLAESVAEGGDRLTFRPCRLVVKDGATWVAPIEWHGSGHLAALAGADGIFAQKPEQELSAGDSVTYYPFS